MTEAVIEKNAIGIPPDQEVALEVLEEVKAVAIGSGTISIDIKRNWQESVDRIFNKDNMLYSRHQILEQELRVGLYCVGL